MRSALFVALAMSGVLGTPAKNETEDIFADIPGWDSQVVQQKLKEIVGENATVAGTAFKNLYAASKNPICAIQHVRDTFETEYYKQFEERTPEEAYNYYLASYLPQELDQGMLNQFNFSHFRSYGDQHLILRFAEFAALSYCENASVIESFEDRNMRMGDFELLATEKDYTGEIIFYTAFNPITRIMVAVFRGSTNKQDVFWDALSIPVPLNLTQLPLEGLTTSMNATVHAGFYGRFITYKKNTTEILEDSLRMVYRQDTLNNGTSTPIALVIVGHSLGAAWALLQAADWALNGINATAAYLYGQPMVGDLETANALSETFGPGKIVRVVNRNDMIPHIGFAPNGSHATNTPEFYYRADGRHKLRICENGMDERCSQGLGCMRWSWRHHSEVSNLSLHGDLCRMNRSVPNSVYSSAVAKPSY